MERDRLRSVLESLLFMAEGSLTINRMDEVLDGVDKKEILSALEESKTTTLGRLLFALGIRHVGEQTGKLLAQSVNVLDDIITADNDFLENVEGIGPVVAESIRNFFHEKANLKTIDRLIKAGLIIENGVVKSSGVLKGSTFVITGTLEGMTRREAKELIEMSGGRTSSSISGKTDYLLAGENAGAKLDRAKKLGVPIIDVVELNRLVRRK